MLSFPPGGGRLGWGGQARGVYPCPVPPFHPTLTLALPRQGLSILFPNILRVGWTFQIRVPIDDTHTWHVMYQVYPQPPDAEGDKQEKIPVYEIPLKDEHG